VLLEASQDGASDPSEPSSADCCEPSSPFDRMLVRRRRQLAMLQESSYDRAKDPRTIEVFKPDAVDYCEPSSPLGGMLLKAKRWNTFTRGAASFALGGVCA